MPKAKKAKAQSAPQSGETTSAYFRSIFKANPKLLNERSNQELLQRWLNDHPGEKEVPQRVKYILSNLKSILRKQHRQKKAKAQPAEQVVAEAPAVEITKPPKAAVRGLET